MLTSIFNFFNQGWVGSATSLIGVLLAGLGILLYYRSRRAAKPSYYLSSTRLLGRKENSLPKEVTIQFDGKNVDRLTKTTLILWNEGSEVLYGAKIVEDDPLRISLNQGDHFLSYHTLKTTNEHNKVRLAVDQNHPHELRVTFAFMNENDGVSVELVHDSSNEHPKILGSMVGLPKGFVELGRTNRLRLAMKFGQQLKGPRKLVLWVMIMMGFALAIVGIALYPTDSDALLPLTLSGLLYILFPALLLWIDRRRYPKELETDGTRKRPQIEVTQ